MNFSETLWLRCNLFYCLSNIIHFFAMKCLLENKSYCTMYFYNFFK